jgi:hypothetical protein
MEGSLGWMRAVIALSRAFWLESYLPAAAAQVEFDVSVCGVAALRKGLGRKPDGAAIPVRSGHHWRDGSDEGSSSSMGSSTIR